MKTPEVTVVIPLYNKRSTIAATIASALAQEDVEMEVVIVDDGSTDGSLEQVRDICDARLRCVSQANGGPSRARNAGVALARGAWTVMLDADDQLLPGALAHFLEISRMFPQADIVDGEYCNLSHPNRAAAPVMINNNFKAKYWRAILVGANITMFRTELLRRHPYCEAIRRYEDEELHFRILREARVASTPQAVARVNSATSQASHPRPDAAEDFFGHMGSLRGSFWERLCRYRFYLEERPLYPQVARKRYPLLRLRYDLLMLHWWIQRHKEYFI